MGKPRPKPRSKPRSSFFLFPVWALAEDVGLWVEGVAFGDAAEEEVVNEVVDGCAVDVASVVGGVDALVDGVALSLDCASLDVVECVGVVGVPCVCVGNAVLLGDEVNGGELSPAMLGATTSVVK
jgi:hypothetical protein